MKDVRFTFSSNHKKQVSIYLFQTGSNISGTQSVSSVYRIYVY